LDLTIVAKADIAREKTSEILHEVANRIRDILSDPQGRPLPEPEPPRSEKVRVDGIAVSSIEHADDFIWNEQALALRKNIAELAEVSENEVSADSTILELGLDSIEAIKLSARLRQHDIALSVSTIMRNTTIRKMQQTLEAPVRIQLAKKLDLLAGYERTVRQCIPNLQDTVAICPTTPLQEAMVAETLASDYTHYFNHDVLKLEEWVDLDQLRAAWIAVVESNDILRTSFAAVEDENGRPRYCQLVHRNSGGHWKLVEAADEITAQVTCDAVMNSVTESADVLSEPPVYLTIVKASKSTHLILSISHALYDGWSLGLLHNDIKRAYFDALTPRPSPRAMIERIFNTDIEASRHYWKGLLHGMAASHFPGSAFTSLEPVPTHRAEKTSALSFTAVRGFCKKAGVTVQTLGQCCWALVLGHYLGETDVVFGSVLSGRDFEQAEDIMFPAMNTVPVRAILHGTYREMLSYMQLNGSSTLKHQHMPLREIQRLLNTGVTRLFDTLFLYQRDGPLGSGDQVLYESVGGTSDNEVRDSCAIKCLHRLMSY
jgi:aryl carrier-like protein